jgi:hypothetical protein
VTSMPSRVTNAVNERIGQLVAEAGFEKIWRLRERVAHRGLALDGYSVFDEPADARLSMSDLSGRAEVRALLTVLNTPAMPQRVAA